MKRSAISAAGIDEQSLERAAQAIHSFRGEGGMELVALHYQIGMILAQQNRRMFGCQTLGQRRFAGCDLARHQMKHWLGHGDVSLSDLMMLIEWRRSNRLVLGAHYDSGLQRANGEGWQTGKILRV